MRREKKRIMAEKNSHSPNSEVTVALSTGRRRKERKPLSDMCVCVCARARSEVKMAGEGNISHF